MLLNKKKYIQGNFIPKNKEKCLNTNIIRFRSSWERKFLGWCDSNTSVIKWGYEILPIKYLNPVKKRISIYLPDFYLEIVDKNGKLTKYVIEIKPSKETNSPKKKNLYESLTFVINISKWTAADKYCKKFGLEFKLVTEAELF